MVEDKFRGFARVASRDGEEPPDGGFYVLELGRFIDENPLAIVPRSDVTPPSSDDVPAPHVSPPVRLAGQSEPSSAETQSEARPPSLKEPPAPTARESGRAGPGEWEPRPERLGRPDEVSDADNASVESVPLFNRLLSAKREDHNVLAREINRRYEHDLGARFMLQGALSDILETDDPEEQREILTPYKDLEKGPNPFNILPLLGLIVGRGRVRPGGRSKKATDHGKNEPHGDGGRALRKADKQADAIREGLNNPRRNARRRILRTSSRNFSRMSKARPRGIPTAEEKTMKLGGYDWIPTVSVGEIKLGEPVSHYLESGLLFVNRFMEESVGLMYEDEGETILVNEEDGWIDGISCYETLHYQGQNLIGLHINDAAAILDSEPIYGEPFDMAGIFDDGRIETPAAFDELGLILYLDEDIVVSAGVSYDLLEEEEG